MVGEVMVRSLPSLCGCGSTTLVVVCSCPVQDGGVERSVIVKDLGGSATCWRRRARLGVRGLGLLIVARCGQGSVEALAESLWTDCSRCRSFMVLMACGTDKLLMRSGWVNHLGRCLLHFPLRPGAGRVTNGSLRVHLAIDDRVGGALPGVLEPAA